MTNNLQTSTQATALKKQQARRPGLDVLKCIAAFFVVCIHCGPYSASGTSGTDLATLGLNALTRMAVPAFFLITGYYYPDMLRRGKIGKQMSKILRIIIAASMFYLLFFASGYLLKGDVSEWLANTFTYRRFVEWLVLNVPFSTVVLWYLWAILYVLGIMWSIDRLGWWKRLFPILGGVILCAVILNFVWQSEIPITRNFLFYGLPFVAAGRLLREYNVLERLQKYSNTLLWGAFFICLALSFTESLILLKVGNSPSGGNRSFYLFTLPMSAIAFLLALRIPASRWSELPARIGRKHSALIYILHPMIISVCSHFIKWAREPGDIRSWLQPFLIFFLTLLISIILQRSYAWVKRHRTGNTA